MNTPIVPLSTRIFVSNGKKELAHVYSVTEFHEYFDIAPRQFDNCIHIEVDDIIQFREQSYRVTDVKFILQPQVLEGRSPFNCEIGVYVVEE